MTEQTILVVDDEDIVLDALAQYLTRFGYEVVTAQNGLEGLHILEHNDIDLAIVDLMMPVMNGMELLDEIRRRKIHTPVMMLTGVYDTFEIAVESLQHGAVDFARKPINYDIFLEKVRKHALSQNNWARKYINFLEAHCADASLNMMTVAAHFHRSRRHISEIFRVHVGQKFTEKLCEIRLTKALALMRDADLSLSEIADQCGFGSLSYFSRRFKKKFGYSPKNWHESAQ